MAADYLVPSLEAVGPREGTRFHVPLTGTRRHIRRDTSTEARSMAGLITFGGHDMSGTIYHPLEHNAGARRYFEALRARASRGPAAAWREAVETTTGGLPSWAVRERAGRPKKAARA